MAAAVLQEIKRDPLSCYICSGKLKDPIGLPCLHTFCYECLCTWHQSSQDKTQVICPECKIPTTVPKSGIRGFLAHPVAEDLKDTVYMAKQSTADVACLVCGKKAEEHCVDCNKSFCHSCKTSHDTFIKDHHTISIQEFQSGGVTTDGRFCQVHTDVQVRYYCETKERQVCVDCVSLYTCPFGHKRLALREAATKHIGKIKELRKTCVDNKKKCQDAIQDTIHTISDLSDSVKQAKSKLETCKQEYMQQVEQVFDEKIKEIEKVQRKRVQEMEDKRKVFESKVSKLEEVEDQVLKLTAGKSDYLITYTFPSISKALNARNLDKLEVVDRSMGYLQYEHIPMSVPYSGYVMKGERWKLIDQLSLNGLEKPQAIAINQDGDICVTSYVKGVKVFSRTGQEKHSFMDDCCQITGVVVSYDNRYILTGGVDYKDIEFYSRKGKHLSSVPVCKTEDKKTIIDAIAIDARNQIMAGLSNNTISIHYADGLLVSKFATKSKLEWFAATSEGDIVCCSRAISSCLLMDYSGLNVRAVQPPPEVKKWVPGYVCCREGEIFVENQTTGYPAGIFRYTSQGHYLGCVTTEVKNPKGIALSQDGMELFVVDRDDQQVKIFHRE